MRRGCFATLWVSQHRVQHKSVVEQRVPRTVSVCVCVCDYAFNPRTYCGTCDGGSGAFRSNCASDAPQRKWNCLCVSCRRRTVQCAKFVRSKKFIKFCRVYCVFSVMRLSYSRSQHVCMCICVSVCECTFTIIKYGMSRMRFRMLDYNAEEFVHICTYASHTVASEVSGAECTH